MKVLTVIHAHPDKKFRLSVGFIWPVKIMILKEQANWGILIFRENIFFS